MFDVQLYLFIVKKAEFQNGAGILQLKKFPAFTRLWSGVAV